MNYKVLLSSLGICLIGVQGLAQTTTSPTTNTNETMPYSNTSGASTTTSGNTTPGAAQATGQTAPSSDLGPAGTTAAPIVVLAPTQALEGERVGIKPQFGTLNFTNPIKGNISRAVYGGTVEFNVIKNATPDNRLYFGPVLGFFYSAIGLPNSDFYGNNGTGFGPSDGYAEEFPVNLKLGSNLSPNFRLSLHGGGNILYRNQPITMDIGSSYYNTNWTLLPNAGVDAEVGLGTTVGLIARPDWTFTQNGSFFTGTLGLVVAIK
jgi:hypothetical protein